MVATVILLYEHFICWNDFHGSYDQLDGYSHNESSACCCNSRGSYRTWYSCSIRQALDWSQVVVRSLSLFPQGEIDERMKKYITIVQVLCLLFILALFGLFFASRADASTLLYGDSDLTHIASSSRPHPHSIRGYSTLNFASS